MTNFTSEWDQFMNGANRVETCSREDSEDWKHTIPEEEEPHSAEEMLQSFPLQFSDIPYPALPHFGVLYLSIPRAVSLIVGDLFILTPHRFPSRSADLLDPEHDAHLSKVKAELKVEVERHLLRAIAGGRLASVTTSGGIEDFLAHGDGLESKRTFIFFKDLVKWLSKNGYGQILDSPMTAFGEYMDSELALAKEVEQLVLKRRRLQEFDDNELAPFTENKGIWGMMLDHTPETDKCLAHATQEIRDLKRRISRMLDSPVQRRLHKKEQDSILIVLAALLELKGHKDLDKDLVFKVERKADRIDGGHCTNTVRKWLGEAIDLIPRSKKDSEKSIEV